MIAMKWEEPFQLVRQGKTGWESFEVHHLFAVTQTHEEYGTRETVQGVSREKGMTALPGVPRDHLPKPESLR